MRYLYDTNIFIYYLADEPKVESLFAESFLSLHDVLVSPIVRIELLSFSGLSASRFLEKTGILVSL
jgi:predicted nucleic acid-binding protein